MERQRNTDRRRDRQTSREKNRERERERGGRGNQLKFWTTIFCLNPSPQNQRLLNLLSETYFNKIFLQNVNWGRYVFILLSLS